MLKEFKEVIDSGNQFGVLLTNILKTFDCTDHKPLITKLYEYGVSSSALNIISYLKHRTQRITGPLLFNINMIDLFYGCEENDIANYANDTTLYSCATDIPTVISKLQAISSKVFNWFGNNHLKAKPSKCHLLLSSKSPETVSIDGIQFCFYIRIFYTSRK